MAGPSRAVEEPKAEKEKPLTWKAGLKIKHMLNFGRFDVLDIFGKFHK